MEIIGSNFVPLLGNSAWEHRKRQGHLQPSVRIEHTSVLLEDYGLDGLMRIKKRRLNDIILISLVISDKGDTAKSCHRVIVSLHRLRKSKLWV